MCVLKVSSQRTLDKFSFCTFTKEKIDTFPAFGNICQQKKYDFGGKENFVEFQKGC